MPTKRKHEIHRANGALISPLARLTSYQISLIRHELKKGKKTQTELAKRFKVSQPTISNIKRDLYYQGVK